MTLAKLRCSKCEHEWSGQPGPSKRPPDNKDSNPDTICPACGSLYMHWTNYEAMALEGFRMPP